MTLQCEQQEAPIIDYIDSVLTPKLEKTYQVFKYRKVGNLYFFLVSKGKNPDYPSKFILTYEITESSEGVNAEYMDSSIEWDNSSVQCPNALLNLTDRTHEKHKRFITACLEYQKKVKDMRTERPHKIELLKQLKEYDVINTKAYGKIGFKQVNNGRKGEFKARDKATAAILVYDIDHISLKEIQDAIAQNRKP